MASLASSQRFEASPKAKRSWLSIVSFFAENKKLVDVELGCKRTMCTYFIPTGDLSQEEQLTNINVS